VLKDTLPRPLWMNMNEFILELNLTNVSTAGSVSLAGAAYTCICVFIPGSSLINAPFARKVLFRVRHWKVTCELMKGIQFEFHYDTYTHTFLTMRLEMKLQSTLNRLEWFSKIINIFNYKIQLTNILYTHSLFNFLHISNVCICTTSKWTNDMTIWTFWYFLYLFVRYNKMCL